MREIAKWALIEDAPEEYDLLLMYNLNIQPQHLASAVDSAP